MQQDLRRLQEVRATQSFVKRTAQQVISVLPAARDTATEVRLELQVELL